MFLFCAPPLAAASWARKKRRIPDAEKVVSFFSCFLRNSPLASHLVPPESLANPHFSHFLPSHPALSRISQLSCLFTSGDFKYLAVTTSERLDYLPDVPTCLEQGVNLSYDLMYYVMFPKGTDPAICQKFAQAFKEISEMPEYAEEIKTAYNQTPYFLDTEESIAYIQEENEKMMAYADYFK